MSAYATQLSELDHDNLLQETLRQRDRAEAAGRRADALERALKRLSFAAQTTGGTAGPDQGLQDAIAEAERVLAQPEPDQLAQDDYPTGPPDSLPAGGHARRLRPTADQPANTTETKKMPNDYDPFEHDDKMDWVEKHHGPRDQPADTAEPKATGMMLRDRLRRGDIGREQAAAGEPSCCARTREEERERCARIAEWAHMVPPDGGSPSKAEQEVAEEAARRIRRTGDTP